MRILLTSLCLFICVGCASYSKKQGFVSSEPFPKTVLNPYFSNPDEDYVYKAKIDAFDKSFGGIFIIKKLSNQHHRIVFTTELGNTIFDFEFQEENFKINRILPEMDKKLLINVLKRDFLALIREKPNISEFYSKNGTVITEALILSKKHYYYFDKDTLSKIVRTNNGKERVSFLFSGINDNIVQEIQIMHQNFKLKIVLNIL